eukprot:1141692-Pelagomonas_calceolata.AAC.10
MAQVKTTPKKLAAEPQKNLLPEGGRLRPKQCDALPMQLRGNKVKQGRQLTISATPRPGVELNESSDGIRQTSLLRAQQRKTHNTKSSLHQKNSKEPQTSATKSAMAHGQKARAFGLQ